MRAMSLLNMVLFQLGWTMIWDTVRFTSLTFGPLWVSLPRKIIQREGVFLKEGHKKKDIRRILIKTVRLRLQAWAVKTTEASQLGTNLNYLTWGCVMFRSWVYCTEATGEAHLRYHAVRGCQDPLVVDEGPSTNMKGLIANFQVNAGLPGPRSSCGINTANYLCFFYCV